MKRHGILAFTAMLGFASAVELAATTEDGIECGYCDLVAEEEGGQELVELTYMLMAWLDEDGSGAISSGELS